MRQKRKAHGGSGTLRCWLARLPWLVGCLVVILLAAASGFRDRTDAPLLSDSAEASALSEDPGVSGLTRDTKFATKTRRPTGPPTIELQHADPQGRVGSVACSTCHSLREPNLSNRSPADLDEFHQEMPMAHGELACYACHNPDDADTLRLADSTPVEYPDVMNLCAQCHGPQARDYRHGAHGGMNGYWDLSRGPRTRNNCIDCHDPHVPAFPKMQPTFKPRDRFLEPHRPAPVQDRVPESEADGE